MKKTNGIPKSGYHRWTDSMRTSLTIVSLIFVAAALLLSASVSALWPATSSAQSQSFPPTGTWHTYAHGDDVLTVVLEGDVLWAGTRAGGVVRWDTTNGTFVQYLKPQTPLAGNTVRDIYVDAQGNKWFATDGGVSVLNDNGTPDRGDDQWHTITRQTSGDQLPSNHVTAIDVDEAGYFWIGTMQYWDADAGDYAGGGLAKLDTKGTPNPSDDEWLHTYTREGTDRAEDGEIVLGLASSNVRDVLAVPGDRVWVATRPEFVYDPSQPGWVEIFGGLSRLDHRGTTEPEDDRWKTWNCEDGGAFSCVTTQLRMDNAGYVWVATRGHGVFAFRHDTSTLDAEDNVFSRKNEDDLASDYIDAITFGPSGDPTWENTVWISTYRSLSYQGEGVSVLNHGGSIADRTDDAWNAQNPSSGEPITTEDGLSDNRVQAMVAGSGTVWMGLGGLRGEAHGITGFDLGSKTFQAPLTTADSTLPYNYVTDLAVGQPGTRWEDTVWVATGHKRAQIYGAGVLRLNTQGTNDPTDDVWTPFTKEGTGLGSNNVMSLAIDGDNVWFGTRAVNGEWREFGWFWLDGGLSVYNGEQWTNRTMVNTGGQSEGLRSNLITSIGLGCQDQVWVGLGTRQGGLGLGIDVLEPNGAPHNTNNDVWQQPFTYQDDFIVSDLITEITSDCDANQTWIAGTQYLSEFGGFRGGGVGVYDFGSGQWTNYTIAAGIESYTNGTTTGEVQSIAVAPDGKVWAGTWGTTAMTRPERDALRPYFPAVINWLDDGTWQHRVFEGDGWVSSIAIDQNDVTWIATSRGGLDFDLVDPEEDDDVVGRATGGIKLTNGSEWVTWAPDNSPLASNDIEVVTVAPNGDVWVGTNGWGVMRFHPGAPATPTPTLTSTSIPPTATPTPTSTGTALPTATHTVTPTPTHTSQFSPTPTATADATDTPTATPTTTPTPTATSSGDHEHRISMPLVARNHQAAEPAPTFTCSGWCEPGASPGTLRQVVTSDQAVDNWRAYMNDLGPFGGVFKEKTATRAVLEVPPGFTVRIEAQFEGEWIVACESVAECP